ncbi:MAG: SiaB family protein kinase [Leptospira sp.]|nr:SiaB family protein kinase [Leptospira sp.]
MQKMDILTYEQYKTMSDHRLLIHFKGALYQDILTELGSIIQTSMKGETKIKKIFAVFVELAQNILHYSLERIANPDESTSGVGMIVVTERPEGYYVSSGNYISSDKITGIEEKIKFINELSPEEKKSYYTKQLRSDRPDDSKGAGVGLIDIARKSDAPLEYSIENVPEGKSFFTLTAFFKKED